MNDYKEFTFGWLILVCMLPAQGIITYLYLNNLGDRPLDSLTFGLFTLLLIFVCLLFYGMTTKVSRELITVSFGIGLIKKKIKIERISSVEAVTNPWYYGWGIRFIPRGMLYNISGSAGVELKFRDTSRIFRIGTKDSAILKREIESRLK